jgi:hypothetical protein
MRPQPRSMAAPLSGGCLCCSPNRTAHSAESHSLVFKMLSLSLDFFRRERGKRIFQFREPLVCFCFCLFPIHRVVLAFWQGNCARGRYKMRKGFLLQTHSLAKTYSRIWLCFQPELNVVCRHQIKSFAHKSSHPYLG